jgi:hypothetical protein
MNNIQDEIDLVGESAASIDTRPPIRANVLPCSLNTSSAHQNCLRHAFPRFGSVSAISIARIRWRDYMRIPRQMIVIARQYTKTTTCAKFRHLNQQVEFNVDTKIRDQ